MPSRDNSTKVSKAGISTSASGERVIAASARADGSMRKEIRVRPGYRPPEDVEVYKNRTAEAWKDRGSGGVPGAETVDAVAKGPTASNKNAKKREARKRAAAAAGEAETAYSDTKAGSTEAESVNKDNDGVTVEGIAGVPGETVDPEAEKEKEARKLAKKLRQARELKDKKDKGDALLPEQFDKVIRINELIRQLDALGFDSDGVRRADDSG